MSGRQWFLANSPMNAENSGPSEAPELVEGTMAAFMAFDREALAASTTARLASGAASGSSGKREMGIRKYSARASRSAASQDSICRTAIRRLRRRGLSGQSLLTRAGAQGSSRSKSRSTSHGKVLADWEYFGIWGSSFVLPPATLLSPKVPPEDSIILSATTASSSPSVA